MISIKRASGGGIVRATSAGYPVRTIAEMKVCGASSFYTYSLNYTVGRTGATPYLGDLFAQDDEAFWGVWGPLYGGGYGKDWGSPTTMPFIEDSILHSHGDAAHNCESKCRISWMERYYSLPSGIINPPFKVMMLLQHAGVGWYRTLYGGSETLNAYNASTAGVDPNGGLQLTFWDVNGDMTPGSYSCTYLLTVDGMRNLNQTSGNTLVSDGQGYALWTGMILSGSLPAVAPLFATSGVVKCRLRWVWQYEYVSPYACPYCRYEDRTAAGCASPVSMCKTASYPDLYVWG